MKESLIQFTNQTDFIDSISNKLGHFRLENKTVLFIEPYGGVLSLLKRGIEKGYNIIVFTAHSDLRMVPANMLESCTLAIQVDTAHENDVSNLAKMLSQKIKIHAVIPGFEYFVPVAAKVSSLLSLPGIDPHQVWNLRRKDLMRSLLKKGNLSVPKHFLITSINDVKQAIEVVGFPAVCKPIDAAGSVNVKKVINEVELMNAAQRILAGNDVLWGYKLSNAMLVEEYIEGKEYSLEGVIQNGKIIHFSMTEKFVSDQIEFIEIGHIVNAPMDEKLKDEIQLYVNSVITVLQADHCPFHAEIRLNHNEKPVLMEIAARLAGDKIGDLINLSLNTNYFDQVYATYFGEPISFNIPNGCFAGIRFFYRPTIEQFVNITGLDRVKKYSIENISIYYNANTFIPAFPKPLRRLGHVIAKHDDYHQLSKMLNDIDSNIIFIS